MLLLLRWYRLPWKVRRTGWILLLVGNLTSVSGWPPGWHPSVLAAVARRGHGRVGRGLRGGWAALGRLLPSLAASASRVVHVRSAWVLLLLLLLLRIGTRPRHLARVTVRWNVLGLLLLLLLRL